MPRPDAVTFKQLRALQALAECGTMTAAAQAIGLTPPAVHTQLRQLEENFACKLLHRSAGHAPHLTLQGRTVLAAAQDIEAVMDACTEHVRALNTGMEGLVILGVVSTGKYFAPGLVAQLQKAYPKIEVMLKVGNRDAIVAALENGSVDLTIMGRPPRVPAVNAVPLGAHPHVIIAAPDHPLAGRRDIEPRALLEHTFLAREEGSGTRILMVRYLDRLGFGLSYKMVELGSNETIKQAVIAGLGVALISRHTVTEELRSGRLVELEIEGLPIMRQWFLIHPSETQLDAASQRVHSFVSDLKGSFLPV